MTTQVPIFLLKRSCTVGLSIRCAAWGHYPSGTFATEAKDHQLPTRAYDASWPR